MSERERFLELYAGHALGALDAAEQSELDTFLARDFVDPETQELDEAVLLLAMTAPVAAPPPELRTRVLQATRPPRRRRLLLIALATTAAAAALFLFLTPRDEQERGIDIPLAGLGHVTFYASRAVVTFDKLQPPPGRDYELWRIRNGKPISLGIVKEREITVKQLTDGDAFAVSLEPQGGAKGGPPTKVLAVAKLP